jgi:hypothetical protein
MADSALVQPDGIVVDDYQHSRVGSGLALELALAQGVQERTERPPERSLPEPGDMEPAVNS